VSVRLDHVALWTRDVERLRGFYERYLGARAGARYVSTNRPGFVSYFLSFPDGGGRLELMSAPELIDSTSGDAVGYAHIAVSIGSPADVEALTARMRADGVRILSAPRRTGDGYFESVVEDPDGNAVELTADERPA
jgi:lactoylglutathione lyase